MFHTPIDMSTFSGEGSSAGLDPERDGESISRDDVYEVLANRRRRYAIHYLQHNGDHADLGTVAEHVAAWENDLAIEAITADQRKRVYTSLQQFHLPKMEELGVVDYDSRAGMVELTEPAVDLEVYLEVVDDYDVPWSLYYLGLAATGSVLIAVSTFGIGPFRAIPTAAWAVFLTVSLAVSSLAHTWVTRRNRLGRDERPPEVN